MVRTQQPSSATVSQEGRNRNSGAGRWLAFFDTTTAATRSARVDIGLPDSADFDYDWLVIGSGFGGSVSALRLAEKGYAVGVLEAGRRFRDEDFAKTTWDAKNFNWLPQLGLRGILRLTPFKDVFIASGAGVGGGSLVYANTLYRAAPAFYRNPQWAGHAGLGAGAEAALRHGRVHAGRAAGAAQQRGAGTAEGSRAALRCRAHLHAHPLRRLLRQARRGGEGPVLRRRRPRAHGLHLLRRVHAGLPHGCQEQPHQELPLVRREARCAHPSRARGGRRSADRDKGRQRGLRGRDRAAGRVVPQATTSIPRPRRRVRRRRARARTRCSPDAG